MADKPTDEEAVRNKIAALPALLRRRSSARTTVGPAVAVGS